MRHGVKLAMVGAIALSLAGCFNERDAEQGGGGGQNAQRDGADTSVSNKELNRDSSEIENSNPVTRDQESQKGAVPLQAEPESGQGVQGQVGDNTIQNPKTTVIARGGEPTTKFDVNSATVEQLQQVPGISHVMAQAIVNNRPYRNKDDLIRRVPNLDKRFLNSFDQYLTFGAPQEKGAGVNR
ncbi:MAG: ComEA family DNA-binding protein [Candidatus Sericytochromatia bacterium]